MVSALFRCDGIGLLPNRFIAHILPMSGYAYRDIGR